MTALAKNPVDLLTEIEKKAYEDYAKSGRPPLSFKTSLELYQLFLTGMSCEEIAKLNPGFNLGMIVRARVEHLWDQRRDTHINELYENASTQLRQTAMESVKFLGVVLAAAHKLHGEKMARYIQTGDEKELGSLNIGSFKQYKEVVETLMKISGGDQKKVIQHTGEVKTVVDVSKAPLDPKVAAKTLKAIADAEDDT